MMGKAYEALGDEPAAYEAFKRSGAIHPYHPDVAREECVALLNLGRVPEGLAIAQRAVRMQPGGSGPAGECRRGATSERRRRGGRGHRRPRRRRRRRTTP